MALRTGRWKWWLALLTVAALLQTLGTDAAPAETSRRIVLVVGDSLSAEYGLARGTGWVKLIGDLLEKQHPDYSVENASISGDTTSGGLSRLPELLTRLHPAVVIIELGANDGLRGLPVAVAHSNLDALISESQKAGARVVLIGIELPPNYGADYDRQFTEMYETLARVHHVPLVPKFLSDFGARRDLFQEDGLHPTAAAQAHLRDRVWAALETVLP